MDQEYGNSMEHFIALLQQDPEVNGINLQLYNLNNSEGFMITMLFLFLLLSEIILAESLPLLGGRV
jgi:hypothetical protein